MEPKLKQGRIGCGINGTVMERLSLEGRTALVTGGSRGIGKAIAIGLAEAGAEVGVLSRQTRKEGEDVCEQLRAIGRTGSFAMLADVTSRKALDAAVDEGVKRWGKVDIVVANAGIGIDVNAEDMTEEQWDRLMDVNLKGVLLLRCFLWLVSELGHGWDSQVELAGSVVGGGSEVDEIFKSPSHSLC